MRRRDFIKAIVGSAAAWPPAARAQQSAVPVIGFLGSTNPIGLAPQIEALRLGLRDHGYIEGQNIVIEYRWAEGRYDLLPALAADLVHHVRCHRYPGHPRGLRSQASGHHDSDSDGYRWEPGRHRACVESRAARREHHRLVFFYC